MRLTLEGYVAMTSEHRRQFDAWLRGENLIARGVTSIEFAEGYVQILHWQRCDPLEHNAIDYAMAGAAKLVERVIKTDSTPPPWVVEYCV